MPRPPAAVTSSAVLSTVRSEPTGSVRSEAWPFFLPLLDERPSTYTAKPARPSSSAIPLPIPRDAPVTKATRCAGSPAHVPSSASAAARRAREASGIARRWPRPPGCEEGESWIQT
eukprot:scaffold65804_cov32-Tisochrysis_lutea.AAC.2